MRDEIIVYWAPANFVPEAESWNMLYPDPENLYLKIINQAKEGADIHRCPALRDLNKNVFFFTSPISNSVVFPADFLSNADKNLSENQALPLESKVMIKKTRDSQYKDHINLSYNMTWTFFAEEPLVAKFTAPYFPAISPVPGAMLASGKYDIGQWFRNWNLDYQVPLSAKSFEVKKDDPLFFVEFETDKKIILKRFTMTPSLYNINKETSNSPSRYGRRMTLQERYQMFHQSRSRDIVLREIKANLLD